MKLGTKSILYGAHCFAIHPFFVALAWIKLFGFPWDLRVWIAFFVHDLGYVGKLDIDGKSGKTHPLLGARIMHKLDGWNTTEIIYTDTPENIVLQDLEFKEQDGWIVIDIIELGSTSFNILLKKRSFKWHDFALYHSRHYTEMHGTQPSKLCFADKMAFVLTPRWLYMPLVKATGELKEYMKDSKFAEMELKITWHVLATQDSREWVEENINT